MLLIMPLSAVLIWFENKDNVILIFILNVALKLYYTFGDGFGIYSLNSLSNASYSAVFLYFSPLIISILCAILFILQFSLHKSASDR